MSDNVNARSSNVSSLSDVEKAGQSAEPRSGDLGIRREFLRRLAISTLTIPVIGGVSIAGEHKKKQKEKESDSKSKSSGSRDGGGKGSSNQRTAARTKSPGAHGATTQHPGGGQTELHDSQAQPAHAKPNPNAGKPLPELYVHWNLHNFDQIQDDENAHVAFLVKALGSNARPMPDFQDLEQNSVHEFAMVARNLENTGVGAYLGALPVLGSTQAGQQYLGAAGSIALIEARHAGYLNGLLDLSIVENITGNVSSFDAPLTPAQVVNLASPFIADLNGGPPLIPPGGLINPLDILNFALALEFLEAAFYNINVPNLHRILGR